MQYRAHVPRMGLPVRGRQSLETWRRYSRLCERSSKQALSGIGSAGELKIVTRFWVGEVCKLSRTSTNTGHMGLMNVETRAGKYKILAQRLLTWEEHSPVNPHHSEAGRSPRQSNRQSGPRHSCSIPKGNCFSLIIHLSRSIAN